MVLREHRALGCWGEVSLVWRGVISKLACSLTRIHFFIDCCCATSSFLFSSLYCISFLFIELRLRLIIKRFSSFSILVLGRSVIICRCTSWLYIRIIGLSVLKFVDFLIPCLVTIVWFHRLNTSNNLTS